MSEVEAGASLDEVARRHRVRDTTLRWWRTQVRRDRSASSVRLVAVTAPSMSASMGRVEVACGGVVLRVEVGTDVAYVAALARALGASC